LRLRGKGLPATKTQPAGDQLVKLVVTLPDVIDAELSSFMERWSRAAGYDVRRKAGFEA
jgi:DnaJ-class molecular chaperone